MMKYNFVCISEYPTNDSPFSLQTYNAISHPPVTSEACLLLPEILCTLRQVSANSAIFRYYTLCMKYLRGNCQHKNEKKTKKRNDISFIN